MDSSNVGRNSYGFFSLSRSPLSPGPNYPLVADEAAHTDNELDQGLWGRLPLLLTMPVNLWSVLASIPLAWLVGCCNLHWWNTVVRISGLNSYTSACVGHQASIQQEPRPVCGSKVGEEGG